MRVRINAQRLENGAHVLGLLRGLRKRLHAWWHLRHLRHLRHLLRHLRHLPLLLILLLLLHLLLLLLLLHLLLLLLHLLRHWNSLHSLHWNLLHLYYWLLKNHIWYGYFKSLIWLNTVRYCNAHKSIGRVDIELLPTVHVVRTCDRHEHVSRRCLLLLHDGLYTHLLDDDWLLAYDDWLLLAYDDWLATITSGTIIVG